jgi:DNA-binding NarL/FixJ family response regulator
MRILIADDHDLLRDTMSSYLTMEAQCDVETCGDLESALAAIAASGPFDVVLLDLSMPGMNGFIGLEQAIAAAEGRPVAVISGTASETAARRTLELGAAGFLPKTLPGKSLINAVRFMAAGERYLPYNLARASEPETDCPLTKVLTERERKVLRGLCAGLSNKEIARDLGLSEPTIKLQVKMVCRKLDARNRTHAAMLAHEAGFR